MGTIAWSLPRRAHSIRELTGKTVEAVLATPKTGCEMTTDHAGRHPMFGTTPYSAKAVSVFAHLRTSIDVAVMQRGRKLAT